MDTQRAALPKLARGLRWRAYVYAAGLFAEVVFIVGCFCWMSEEDPCKVQHATADSEPRGKPCREATYLFCIFYLGLAKDLTFFLAGLKTEDLNDVPGRLRNMYTQYIASLIFLSLTSAVAAVLYMLQPTEHLARRVLYMAFGAAPNAAVVLDCIGLASAARRKGYQAIFPDVEEIRPIEYAALHEKSWANTWYLKECSICLDSFAGEDSVVRLPCGHVFHTDCVVGWLNRTLSCPVRCRLGHFVVAAPPKARLGARVADDSDAGTDLPPAAAAREPAPPAGRMEPAAPAAMADAPLAPGGTAAELPPQLPGLPLCEDGPAAAPALEGAGSVPDNSVSPTLLGMPGEGEVAYVD